MKKILILCSVSFAFISATPAQPSSTQDIKEGDRQLHISPVHLAQFSAAASGGLHAGGMGTFDSGGVLMSGIDQPPLPPASMSATMAFRDFVLMSGIDQPPLPPIAQNYAALADIIIPELILDGSSNIQDFIYTIQESFPINFLISSDRKILESTLPNMHFTKVSLSDVLDALNDFALLSPEYNLIFKSRSNIISVLPHHSPHDSYKQRSIYTFPMAELNQKFEIETILSLLQSILEMEPTSEFKNSTFEPKYHPDTQTLMLKLVDKEFPVVQNTFNTLIANAQSMDVKRSILIEKFNQLHLQSTVLEKRIEESNLEKIALKSLFLEKKNHLQSMQRENKNLWPPPQEKINLDELELNIGNLESDINQLKAMLDTIKSEMFKLEFKL